MEGFPRTSEGFLCPLRDFALAVGNSPLHQESHVLHCRHQGTYWCATAFWPATHAARPKCLHGLYGPGPHPRLESGCWGQPFEKRDALGPSDQASLFLSSSHTSMCYTVEMRWPWATSSVGSQGSVAHL